MAMHSDYAVHPGEYLAEWMEDSDVNAAEISRLVGYSRKHISELLSGKAALTAETAARLERATGVPARLWNRYESQYREDKARLDEALGLEAMFEDIERFPLPYLRKAGYVTATKRDKATVVDEVLCFFGVANVDAWRKTWAEGSVAYRRSVASRENAPLLATWLTCGERAIDLTEFPKYSERGLRQRLPLLRALTAGDPGTCIHEAIEALGQVGVGVVLVPPVPGAGVHGATRWLHKRPLIQLSLRGKSNDQIWFTLFHEIGHVLLHSVDGLYLDAETSEAEDEANRFATETLVPTAYGERLPVTRDAAAIVSIAAELGIAPAIVLGQAQRRTGDFAWGHHLKDRYRFVDGESD